MNTDKTRENIPYKLSSICSPTWDMQGVPIGCVYITV